MVQFSEVWVVYGRQSVPPAVLLSDSQQQPTQTVPRHAPTLPIPRDSGGDDKA